MRAPCLRVSIVRACRFASRSAEYGGLRVQRCLLQKKSVTTIGRGLPPKSWSRGGDAYDLRAAAPNMVVFVFNAACSILRRELTPGLAP